MAESLKNKTIKGVGWSAIDNVAQYGVSFVVSIILARLLSPDDYGLIGIVFIFTVICNTLLYSGFGNALIREKDATDDDYNTVFWVNMVFSVLLYTLIYFCSPFIAFFFHRDELVALTRVSSVGIIVGALALVHQTILTKQIDFKSQTKITFVASVCSGLVGIIMAFIGLGVWALVTQGLVNTMIHTLFLWIYKKWYPRFLFSMNSFRSLFGFGWKLMVSGLLDSIWKQLYQVVVGKFYSPASLGQYSRASHFSDLFSSNLTVVIQRVTYPVLSDMQGDTERMVAAYRKIIKSSVFISSISMFSLGAVSEPLLYCLIGPKWHEAAVYLPLICICSSTYPLHAINLNMLQVQGRSDLFLGLEIVKKIIGVGPLIVGALVGILPMLYTNMVTTIIAFFLNSYYSGKFLGYSSMMQVKDILPFYEVATIVASSVYFLKYLPVSYWIVLPLQGFIGIVIFIIMCKVFKLEEYREYIDLFNKALKRVDIISK